jgi:prepilin-type N-terminal cleavage/methylation domain-containing protein
MKPQLLRKNGVTLLEALIALAIIGTAFGAVLELQANLVRGLYRVEAAHKSAVWSLNATEIGAMIERERDRAGAFDFDDGSRITWQPATGSERWESPTRMGVRMRGEWIAALASIDYVVIEKGEEIVRTRRLAVTAERAPNPETPQ